VNRDHDDALVAGECIGDAVAVMRVEIDIEDRPDAAIEQAQHGEHGIVEIAEAGGAVAAAVMGAAGRAVDDRAVARAEQDLGRLEAGAARRRQPREDLGEQRVAVAADIEATGSLRRDMLVGLGAPQRRDVIGRVKAHEFVRRRQRALDIGRRVEPAQNAHEIDHRGDARDRQRMAAAIRRTAVDVAADEERGRCHWR